MKRQLDRLKGKRLVTGDPNLMTKDEICINATPNGVEVKEIGTDGKIKDLAGTVDSGSSDVEYYKIDWNVASSDWEKVLLIRYDNENPTLNHYKITSRAKVDLGDSGIVICANDTWTKEQLIAFSYTPILISKEILNDFNLGDKSICSFNDIISVLNACMIMQEDGGDLSMKGITPITKEEFYDLNNI